MEAYSLTESLNLANSVIYHKCPEESLFESFSRTAHIHPDINQTFLQEYVFEQNEYVQVPPEEFAGLLRFFEQNRSQFGYDELGVMGQTAESSEYSSDSNAIPPITVYKFSQKFLPEEPSEYEDEDWVLMGDGTGQDKMVESQQIKEMYEMLVEDVALGKSQLSDSKFLHDWIIVEKIADVRAPSKEIAPKGFFENLREAICPAPPPYEVVVPPKKSRFENFFANWPSFGTAKMMKIVLKYSGEAFYFGSVQGTTWLLTQITARIDSEIVAGAIGISIYTLILCPEILLNFFVTVMVVGVASGLASALPVLVVGTTGVVVSATVYHAYILSKRTVNAVVFGAPQ
eukprot:TRINITY_DN10798_c0_g1_i1.p1 TRINITY_DN10798_c0_g1~~TRINITY_DN10798_c0_g1_i1.p1  ORF type:complete len:344 (-),score=73.14 TRINITY_DN10798_c0_g1_i1:126-1157(-)